VVHLTENGLNVLRPGAITTVALERALRAAGHAVPVRRLESHRSPGHLEAHYQPANRLVWARRAMNESDLRERARALIGRPEVVWLDLPPDPALAARRLYAELRRLSVTPAVILFDPSPLAGSEWEAILDRLRRASTTTWT
jgi:hypothetical protein